MTKKTKAFCFVFLALTVWWFGIATASGIPKASEAFGIYIPSIEFAIMRAPETNESYGSGILCTWTDLTEAEYKDVDAYFASAGCSCESYENREASAVIYLSYKDKEIEVVYDLHKKTISELFPSGTRPETQRNTEMTEERSIFPKLREVFDIEMPNMSLYPDWNLIEESTDQDDIIVHRFSDFTENNYAEFESEINACGCTLISQKKLDDSTILSFSKSDSEMKLVYYNTSNEVRIIYSASATPSSKVCGTKGEGTLPSFSDVFGVSLPALGTVLMRWPDENAVNEAGQSVQYYNSFSDDDYKIVSSFLLKQGCELVDYTTDGDVLSVELKKNGYQFTMVYDRKNARANVIYPIGAKPEAIVNTPTPIPEPTAMNTPAPTEIVPVYSEEQCWQIALDYFNNLRWNDPDSVTVFSHKATYNDYEEGVFSVLSGTYTFSIDYSATNQLGGKTRDTYSIVVSALSGRVVFATN